MIQHPSDPVARARRPQAFGRSRRPRIDDPLIEPLWIGERVLVQLHADAPPTGSFGDGAPLETWHGTGEELQRVIDALALAVQASSAIVDGYLTRQAAQPPQGMIAGLETLERRSMTQRLLLGDSRGRQEAERREQVRNAADAMAAEGIALAFVAIDLLEIDGEQLLDVPLLERKRHLDASLAESKLVRVGPFVRAPATRWYGTWRATGFFEMAMKAANSHYRPGEANEDWAIVPIPRR